MKTHHPPKWAKRFLQWYCDPYYLEEIEGDIQELFERRSVRQSSIMASVRFVWDVFRFLRWSNIRRSNSKLDNMHSVTLFKNYLKLGWRNIGRNLASSSINIVGLSIAICFTVSVYIFIDMQKSMDAFHTKSDRIYQLTNFIRQEGEDPLWSDSPILLGPKIKEDHPEIEAFSRIEFQSASIRFKSEVYDELVLFVDEDYFDMLDFSFAAGGASVLSEKNLIVISDDMATKYFKYENPLGKELSFKFTNGVIKRMTVGAVLDEFPYNSSMNFNFYVPIQNFFDLNMDDHYGWDYMTDATFVQLKSGYDISTLESSYEEYIQLQHASNPEWKIRKIEPIPLTELSLNGYRIYGSIANNGHPAGRIALIIISVLLLSMACFNFMNIAVASASRRLKEIALRKVMGGFRKQIIQQFLVENTLQCFFALLIGILLSYFFMIPLFDAMVNELDVRFRTYDPWSIAIFLVVLLLIVGLISGAYPALYISKFNSISIFKGSEKFGSKNFFSRILLGFQFFLAIMTIVGCFIMVDQNNYMSSKDWGYDPNGVISVYVSDEEQYRVLKNDLSTHPDVIAHSAADNLIGRGIAKNSFEQGDKQFPIRAFSVSEGFVESFQLRLLEGRALTNSAYDRQSAVVVNQQFVKAMGWEGSPINQTFVYDSVPKTVVGLVEDFHYYDFYSEIDPVLLQGLNTTDVRYLSFRIRPENIISFEEVMKSSWQKVAPNDPFDRIYQEDAFDRFYQENQSNTSLLLLISGMAIVLASLGLYGLLSFNIQGKLKEFSVRKVLGAHPKVLVRIAIRQYFWVFIIAFTIGAPLGSIGMTKLVQTIFPDPKGISALPFMAAILIIIFILFFTIAGQINRAIKVNPADLLRNE